MRIRTQYKASLASSEQLFSFAHTCLGTSAWNFLDAMVIASDLMNEVIALALGSMPSRPFFMALRILRLLRQGRMLTFAPALSTLFGRLSRAVEAAAWGILLLVMLLSVWAIVAVELLHPLNASIAQSGVYDDCQWCANAFNSVAEANLTLMRHIIMGDGWGDVLLVLVERHPWTAGIFLLAFASINLGLLGVVVASMAVRAHETYLAQDALASAADESCEILKSASYSSEHAQVATELLLNICAELDNDGSGMTIEKVVEGFEKKDELRSFLRSLGVYRDDLQCIFAILDEEGTGIVSHKVFAEQLLRMQARSNDSLLMFIRLHTGKAQQKIEDQLIWFEQRRKADSVAANVTLEKKDLPRLDTDLFASSKAPVDRPLTPFATVSEFQSSGSLPARLLSPLATLASGQVGSKVQDLLAMPEEKLQVQNTTTSPINVASELGNLRHQIDVQLDALAREFARNNGDAPMNPGELPHANKSDMSIDGILRQPSGSLVPVSPPPMPSPDIAVPPPPVETSRQRGRRSKSPRAGSSGRGMPRLPSAREEEPPLLSWRQGLQQAFGTTCCETQQARSKELLVTVDPVK